MLFIEDVTINMSVFDSENWDNSFSSQSWLGITVISETFFLSFQRQGSYLCVYLGNWIVK